MLIDDGVSQSIQISLGNSSGVKNTENNVILQ